MPAIPAREHGEIDPLATGVAAEEERGHDATDRAGVQQRARPIATRRQGGAHPLNLVGDHEQVAVHERRGQREQTGDAQRLEGAEDVGIGRGRAEEHGADDADGCLDRHLGEHVEARFGDRQWSDRPHGPAVADERQERRDEEDQRQDHARAAPDRARSNTGDGGKDREHREARGVDGPGGERSRDADDGHADEAEDLRPRVEPVDRARRIAGEPDHSRAVLAEPAHAGAEPRRGSTARRRWNAQPKAEAAMATAIVPTKPASPVATLGSSTPGNA